MDSKARADRRPQGPRKPSREREAYLQLVDQGIPDVDACRIVGVNTRTGRRWRNGRQASGTTAKTASVLARARRCRRQCRERQADAQKTAVA